MRSSVLEFANDEAGQQFGDLTVDSQHRYASDATESDAFWAAIVAATIVYLATSSVTPG